MGGGGGGDLLLGGHVPRGLQAEPRRLLLEPGHPDRRLRARGRVAVRMGARTDAGARPGPAAVCVPVRGACVCVHLGAQVQLVRVCERVCTWMKAVRYVGV